MLNDVHSICGYIISKYFYYDMKEKGFAIKQLPTLINSNPTFLRSIFFKLYDYFASLSLRHKYLFVGLVLANLPDIDVLLTPIYGFNSYHRTFTHSIFGNCVTVPFITLITQKILGLKGFRGYLNTLWFVFLCIFSHIITDYITNYGTSINYPFNKKPVSLGVVTVLDFTTILYFYTTYFISKSGQFHPTNVLKYSTLGFFFLMFWKRGMLLDVFDKTYYMIQNIKKKHKNTIIWLQPSNIFNNQFSLMKFDEKSKSTTQLKVVSSSFISSFINYFLDFFKLRKIDVRKYHLKSEIQEIDQCAPRNYLPYLYRENRPLFYSLLRHTFPSILLMLAFHTVHIYQMSK